MHRIAKISVTAAIIAGLGIATVSPIISYADDETDINQQQQIATQADDMIVSIEVDGKRTFQDADKAVTFLSAETPKKVDATFKKLGSTTTVVPIVDTAKDVTLTINGQSVKAKQYTTTFNGNTATINWVKPGDLFANTKISMNNIQAQFDAYGDNKDAQNTTPQYYYSAGTATINTSMSSQDFKNMIDTGGFSFTGLPTGWTQKNITDSNATKTDTEATYTYEFTNTDFSDYRYRININIVNTVPQQQPQETTQTPEAQTATSTSPELVQTGIEQTATATAAIAAIGVSAYAISRKRNK